MLSKSPLAALIIFLAGANTSWGEVIYSNLNSDPTRLFNEAFLDYASNQSFYDPATGTRRPNEKLAMSFVAAGTSNWMVTQIDLALREDLGGTFTALLGIYADSAGLPGAPLGTWTLTHIPVNSHLVGVNCCGMTTLSLADSPVFLTGGSRYFLVAEPVGTITTDVWYWNTIGATGTNLKADSNGTWRPNPSTTLGAFDVLGVAVGAEAPEPSTVLLFLTGVAAWALRQRFARA